MSQRQYIMRSRSLLVHGNSIVLPDNQLGKAPVDDAIVGWRFS